MPGKRGEGEGRRQTCESRRKTQLGWQQRARGDRQASYTVASLNLEGPHQSCWNSLRYEIPRGLKPVPSSTLWEGLRISTMSETDF